MKLPTQFSGLNRCVSASYEARVIASWDWSDIVAGPTRIRCCKRGLFGKPVCTEYKVPAWQNCWCQNGNVICRNPVFTQG